MKKYIHSVILMSCLCLTTSCADFLDKEPDDMLTMDMVFNDKVRTGEWLAGLYNFIPDPFSVDYTLLSDCAWTDDWAYSLDLNNWFWPASLLYQGSWNTSNALPRDPWPNTYKKIRQALLYIENVKPLPEQNFTERDVQQGINEARFLMAYYYYYLLEHFGPFPLVTELFDVNDGGDVMLKPRTPFGDIVDYLDRELLELSEFFPDVANDSQNYGRPTKGICLAVRARMLLMAASPLFNGNPDFKDVKNPDGTPIFYTEYDPQRWKRAADACKLVLNLATDNGGKGVYDLYKEYYGDTDKIDAFASLSNLWLKMPPTNKEIIWGYTSSSNLNLTKLSIPKGSNGWGSLGLTQNLVDAFLTKNGLPIDEDPEYDETSIVSEDIYYPNTAYKSNSKGIEGLVVEAGTFSEYANREPRFYTTVCHQGTWLNTAVDGEGRRANFLAWGTDGGGTHPDYPPTGYNYRRGVDYPSINALEDRFPMRPSIIMRLAEFYLGYIEALNEYEPSNPDILLYLNKIRERAGLPSVAQSVLGTAEMKKIIRREWRSEFAGDFVVRSMNLKRWLEAEEIFATPLKGANVDTWEDKPESYLWRKDLPQRYFRKKNYLMPINQNSIDNNPNLVQNPLW